MTTRLLPPEEWHRLDGTDTAAFLPHVDPADLQIAVLEDGEQIVGACAIWHVPHVEGLWIAPAYRRRVGVLRALLRQTWAILGGRRWVVTSACAMRTKRRLQWLGGRQMPGESFVLSVGAERLCRHLQR